MSISQCVIAAAAAVKEPSIGVVVATGLTIVFVVLILLYLLIVVEGLIFQSIDNKKNGVKPEPKAKKADKPAAGTANVQTVPPAVQKGIPGEVIAAISAALSCMMGGGKYTIRSVTRAKQGRSAWSSAASASYTEPF
ncbi:MAG: OadG family transporter subunit [Ruthenibacterium sp.]